MLTAVFVLYVLPFLVFWFFGLFAITVMGKCPTRKDLLDSFLLSLVPGFNAIMAVTALIVVWEEYIEQVRG